MGTWMFASAERRRSVMEVALRVAGVITCVLQLLVTLAFMQATDYWTCDGDRPGTISAASQLTAIVWAIAAVLTFDPCAVWPRARATVRGRFRRGCWGRSAG